MKRTLSLLLCLLLLVGFVPLREARALEELQNVNISSDGILTWSAFGGAGTYDFTVEQGINSGGGYVDEPYIDLEEKCAGYGFENGPCTINLYAMDKYGWQGGVQISATWTGTYNYTGSLGKLAKPTNITWNGNIITWDAVTHADRYTFILNGGDHTNQVFSVSSCSVDVSPYLELGTQTYTVRIYAEASGYSDSDEYQGTVTLTGSLPALQNVSISAEGILSWDAFSGAGVYDFTVGGSGGYVEETSLDLAAKCAEYGYENGTYEVKLVAMNKEGWAGGVIISDEWKGNYTYTASLGKLATPTNITWSGNDVSWDPVANAEGYTFIIAGGDSTNLVWKLSTNSASLNEYLEEGTKSYLIRIYAEASGYTDSDEYSATVSLTKAAPAEPQYTVTVSNDGHGTGMASPTSTSTGKEVALTATPNSGYKFKEWQVVSGGVTVTDNKFIMGSANVEVKAIFEPGKTYTVTFKSNGGSSVSQQTVDENKTATKPTDPTRDDFSFVNWCTDSALIAVYDFSKPVTSDLILYAKWTPVVRTVTVTNDGNGTASASAASGTKGTTITLTATPNSGYQFDKWEVLSGWVTITDNKFVIGSADVEVKALFEKIPDVAYTITVTSDGNGTATASHTSAATGKEITLIVSPKEGYHLKEWQVISGGVTVTNNKFTMGTSNVEIKAIFEKDGSDTTPTPTPTPSSGSTTTPDPSTVKKVQAKKSLKLTAPKIKKATYLWQYRTGKTGAWLSVRKGTKQKLSVKATMALDGYQYRCQVKAPAGTISYTDIYELYVYEPLRVRKQPKWGKICLPGTKRTISITAQGASNYQWVTRANGSSPWTKIEGATGTSYVVDVQEGMNNRQYACEISGKAGTARSKAAVVKIAPWPKVKITRQPQWKKPVTSGSPVTLSVKALNAETYQWYYRTSAKGAWIIMGGETKTTVTFPAPANGNGYQYKCTAKGKGGTVDSKPVTLKVVTP